MAISNSLTVYLAGPINGCTDEEAKGWRDRVVGAVDGVTFIDPMERDYRGAEDANVDEIVDKDKQCIDQCDILLANVWKPSVGTAMEIMWAYERGLEVVLINESDGPMSPWLRYHSNCCLRSIDEAIEMLRLRKASA